MSYVYYLSGPMRGYPNLNFPAFERITKKLRAQGLTIVSPHEFGDINAERGQLMGDDLLAIINKCGAVAIMDGWLQSPGARAEVATAFATDKPVFDVIENADGSVYLVESTVTSVMVPRESQYKNKIPLLGLCGFAQSGKDTIASYLTSQCGYTRVAFADKLKDVAYALNPLIPFGTNLPIGHDDTNCVRLQWLVDSIGWDSAKVDYPEVRALLQRLGTEAGRVHIDDNLWVNLGEQQIEQAGTPVVVTDVRFPNEVQMVRRRGGKLVWVHRPGVGAVNGHASEHSVTADDCDRILVNDRSIVGLQSSAFSLVNELFGALV